MQLLRNEITIQKTFFGEVDSVTNTFVSIKRTSVSIIGYLCSMHRPSLSCGGDRLQWVGSISIKA